MIDGLILKTQKNIYHEKGNILHALKLSDVEYKGFGEAYFSSVINGQIKGWKKHTIMFMNILVPVGSVRFVIYDDRKNSSTYKNYNEIELSKKNYQRMTIPPNVWVAFQGTSKSENLVLNIASIEHDPEESINIDLDKIKYDWGN